MLLLAQDALFAEHDAGRGHPERPARLEAVAAGIADWGLDDAIRALPPRDATTEELERVHTSDHLDRIRKVCEAGGGPLDLDTGVSSRSWAAALRAAGAGLAAAEALAAGQGGAAFLAVRPPGHHARPGTAMGFCLFNNVAVTAAALTAAGDRVCVVDYDAHHGNGTQEIFYADPRVLYVSLHEWPLYPGTGRLDDIGTGPGTGTTCNVPLPARATGDVYLHAFDDVIEPIVDRFAPDWLLVSVGFDAHRADPLTGLGLSAGDYAALATRMAELAPGRGRLIAFLEGGYDLDAIRASVTATVPALIGEPPSPAETPTGGGPGDDVVGAARRYWEEDVVPELG
jgi:acetoin utilization deacetylase AcuC-like enzyme